MAGEGEGETQRQSSTFHSHVVQEVGDAVHNVVKELERDMLLVVCILEAIVRFSITLFSMERQKVLDAFCKFCLLWPFDVKQKCAEKCVVSIFLTYIYIQIHNKQHLEEAFKPFCLE